MLIPDAKTYKSRKLYEVHKTLQEVTSGIPSGNSWFHTKVANNY
jgi:hypothetical protein